MAALEFRILGRHGKPSECMALPTTLITIASNGTMTIGSSTSKLRDYLRTAHWHIHNAAISMLRSNASITWLTLVSRTSN